jgi:hypothetical protein
MRFIAEDLGIDRKTVYNVARRAGLPRRHVFDDLRRGRIVDAYRAGTPVTDIAEAEGVHRSYVRNLARKANLPPRKDWARRYPIDESVFDSPTPVGWWLVGLLAADGCVRIGNLISLPQKKGDIDVLRAFLAYVGCPDRPLTHLKLSDEAKRRSFPRSEAYEARIWSARLKQALASHGVTADKTKKLRFSPDAASQPGVWLGLLDGDGWVSETGQRGRPVLAFYGTPSAMRQCSDFWAARLEFQRVSSPTLHRHRAGLRSVRLYGANAGRAAQILLASTPVSLQRKRRRLEAIAQMSLTPRGTTPPAVRTSKTSN